MPSYGNPQSLNRYSYVLNNPLRYTDPTGHWADDGYVGNHSNHFDCKKYAQYCNNGKKKSDEELQDMAPKPQPKSAGGGLTGQCGVGGVSNCPPLSFSYPNFSVLAYPSVTLHPSDFLLGNPLVGVTPVYSSSSNELTGYYEIVYHGSNPDFNSHAVGSLNQWGTTLAGIGIQATQAVVKKVTGAVVCPHCGGALIVIGVADLANQSVTFQGNAEVGVFVPVHDMQPLDLSDWQDPFFR